MKSADFDTCLLASRPGVYACIESRSIAITTVTDCPVQLSRCAGIAASSLQHQRGSGARLPRAAVASMGASRRPPAPHDGASRRDAVEVPALQVQQP